MNISIWFIAGFVAAIVAVLLTKKFAPEYYRRSQDRWSKRSRLLFLLLVLADMLPDGFSAKDLAMLLAVSTFGLSLIIDCRHYAGKING